MTDLVLMVGVFLAGLILGSFFFGGLLWTVRRGLSARRPWLWFLASWIVRSSVVLGGFYLLFDGRWERLMVCVAGFLLSRIVVIRFSRSGEKTLRYSKEAEDAS